MSVLIAETTREEREAIVADALGSLEGACDGCAPGLARMYDAYIEGKMELREVNRLFSARYVRGSEGPERQSCPGGMEE